MLPREGAREALCIEGDEFAKENDGAPGLDGKLKPRLRSREARLEQEARTPSRPLQKHRQGAPRPSARGKSRKAGRP